MNEWIYEWMNMCLGLYDDFRLRLFVLFINGFEVSVFILFFLNICFVFYRMEVLMWMEISLLVEILVVIVVGNELWVNNVSNG